MNVVNLNSASLNSKRLNVVGEIRSSAGGGEDYTTMYLTIEAVEDGAVISIRKNDVFYKIGKGEWTSLAAGVSSPQLMKGERISLKANGIAYDTVGNGTLCCSKRFIAMGNMMSMLYGDEFSDKLSLSDHPKAFMQFFKNSRIVDAQNLKLPAMELSNQCYYEMFYTCENLVTAPELPATELKASCYGNMFSSCKSLITAPELPAIAITTGCYSSMFAYCSSLVQAPKLLAEVLNISCYSSMFKSCSNLNKVQAMFLTHNASLQTNGWLSGVAATGVFVKNSKATWTTIGVDGVPSGWTIEYADA